MLSTLGALSYNAAVHPYNKSRISNIQEILNEAAVLMASYTLLAFTEWMWELKHK